jgi:hypothetical protein
MKQDVSAGSLNDGVEEPSPKGRYILAAPPGWIRWMSWGPIGAGDCTMTNAIVYLYQDGMIFFQANTRSSANSDDVWLLKSMQFFDQWGTPVGDPVPQHDGMTMAWPNTDYPFSFWDAIPGVNPSGAAQIRKASMNCHC